VAELSARACELFRAFPACSLLRNQAPLREECKPYGACVTSTKR
jgi:hypothetical protein